MAFTTSPNMNLIIPGVGTEQGPDYAFDVNASLTLIDQHDHTPGNGVQITPAGLNINTSLTMNGNDLTHINDLTFLQQGFSSVPLSLYVAPGGESPVPIGDLWYNDSNGTAIQITENGIVKTVASSIPGESYAGGTFFWTQAQSALPTTPANFDIGHITIRPNIAATTFGVVINPPGSISSLYSLFLPVIPASTKIMQMDASGQMLTTLGVDNVTIAIIGNNLTVIAIPDGTVTTAKIADGAVTGDKLANVDQNSVFISNNTFTVPSGVTELRILGCGAGGGGGGGGGTPVAQAAGGGGGGGAGEIQEAIVTVAPGDQFTITIGTGGSGGAGGTSASGLRGSPGSAGTNSSVAPVGLSTSIHLTFIGGAGGGGGGGSVQAAASGSNSPFQYALGGAAGASSQDGGGGAGSVGQGGAGSSGSGGGAGQIAQGKGAGGGGGSQQNSGGRGGTSTYTSSASASAGGATNVGGGGGGGGGGSGLDIGGDGGNGNGTPTAGGGGSRGAGGGGGGGRGVGTGNGAAGGAGGGGKITIFWTGHT